MTSDHQSARAWRIAKGYTQAGLARALGISLAQLKHMETGHRPGGKPIGPKDWQRYCLMCAGLHHLEGQPHTAWDWPEG